MSDGEVADFLDEQRTVICATIGRDGAPHVMPLWFIVRDGDIWAWTYASSQRSATSSATRAPHSRSRTARPTRSCAA